MNKLTKLNQYSIPSEIKFIPKYHKLIYEANMNLRKFENIDIKSNDPEDIKDMDALLDLLMKWKIYSGIVNQPTQVDYVIILEFIHRNFEELNLYDISAAIDLSTSNKLEFKKSASDESFSIFSPMYVGRILSAYLLYKKELIFDTRHKIDKQTLELAPKIKRSIDETLIDTKKYIKEQYLVIKKEKYNYDDYFTQLFDFLYKNKFLIITDELKSKALEYANKKIIALNNSEQINQSNFVKAITSLKKSIQKTEFSSKNETISVNERNKIKFSSNYCVIKFFLELEDIDKFIENINETHEKVYIENKFN